LIFKIIVGQKYTILNLIQTIKRSKLNYQKLIKYIKIKPEIKLKNVAKIFFDQ
jgi:hypothetical protein